MTDMEITGNPWSPVVTIPAATALRVDSTTAVVRVIRALPADAPDSLAQALGCVYAFLALIEVARAGSDHPWQDADKLKDSHFPDNRDPRIQSHIDTGWEELRDALFSVRAEAANVILDHAANAVRQWHAV